MAKQHSKDSQIDSGINNNDLKSTHHRCTYENCKSFFITKGTLENHLRIHKGDKPFPCVRCNMSFITLPALIRHNQTHTEISCYCHVCSLVFRSCSDLSRHMDSHNDKKAHTCLVCNRHFSRTDSLLEHIENHVINNSSGLLFCNICKKSFKRTKVYTFRGHLKGYILQDSS